MMSNTKLQSQDEIGWDAALALYGEQLRFYLDYLLECACCDCLLAKVEATVKDSFVPDGFKQRFMVRALVKLVIEHTREHTHASEAIHDNSADLAISPRPPDAAERLVYFMRDILEYSTRETSLLIGTTDAQVEKLLTLARKQIDMFEGPSSIAIENPNGSYFRWRFDELHPG